MHKKILLSTITCLSLLTNTYAAQLEEIKVTTATKTEKSIDGVSASIIVISKEDIEKTGASTLDTVLKKIPSINAQFGNFPHPSAKSKASISLRGVGANGTLILIDGKRLSAETESPYEMTRISASMIERIEIVKGSMSTLYGSDAIGGVINIITKKIDHNTTSIDMKYGANKNNEARNKNINFNTMGKNESIKYKVYGSINDTSPFTVSKSYSQQATDPTSGAANNAHALDNIAGKQAVTYRDESTVKTIGTRLEKDLSDDLKIGMDLNYFIENTEGQYMGNAKTTSGGLALIKNTPVNSKDKNRRIDASFDLDYIINDDLSIDTKVYRSYYKKRNETDPINFSGPTNKKFSANVTIDTLDSNLKYALNDSNFITSGIEYRKEKRESGAINPNPASSEFITKTIEYKSLFVQDEIEFSDTLNATIGARYDNISNAENKITFQAGIIKNLNDNTNLRVNYAQGYRSPDIAELYVVSPLFKDGKRFGSDVIFGPKTTAYDLKPEQSETFEVSLSNRFNSFTSELTLFNNKIKDKISLVSYGSGAAKYYTSENLSQVDIKGTELALGYDFSDNFDIGFNLTYLKTENESNSKELTYTPDISASLNSNYKITQNLATNLMLRYIGEQYTDTLNTTKADSYNLVDLGASYKINKHVQVYGGIDNIFDEQIDEDLGTNIGTYFYTGLKATF
ncbi:TonB-dependent receptor plug domain-containing protein [Poseidonibacter ostreae]|jgi:outer membrane receptor for ferrienterochelin and colicins|uniref:TonB-dependent receptor n=1 Tax=Poseidonibacter ostreae TaxID=2654171 RepID=A0A6L4WPY8_9BACT|nr:TonB-dependent receptor [Poseidonibacter ostreae]KAB7886477.1 TonB-dependent receptor [Poseidonibacter ostreae]KAB7887458.1 TonB-dependent receptor [Poseidonibacter ostreae]KAB7891837.1 TonB-dependent receptor [Poseidonibacter ostreae]MAC83331.1 TonB-dependent receptor [Arcobacter sp.]|tara:strand:+ start:13016 stop:15073 length:2058 start_codon:yes stop_codon:yes gene_type:complete